MNWKYAYRMGGVLKAFPSWNVPQTSGRFSAKTWEDSLVEKLNSSQENKTTYQHFGVLPQKGDFLTNYPMVKSTCNSPCEGSPVLDVLAMLWQISWPFLPAGSASRNSTNSKGKIFEKKKNSKKFKKSKTRICCALATFYLIACALYFQLCTYCWHHLRCYKSFRDDLQHVGRTV